MFFLFYKVPILTNTAKKKENMKDDLFSHDRNVLKFFLKSPMRIIYYSIGDVRKSFQSQPMTFRKTNSGIYLRTVFEAGFQK